MKIEGPGGTYEVFGELQTVRRCWLAEEERMAKGDVVAWHLEKAREILARAQEPGGPLDGYLYMTERALPPEGEIRGHEWFFVRDGAFLFKEKR